MSDLPEIRIGTAEREQALDALTRHFSDGRLTVTEFDERSGQIASATTRGQLDTVFADLPALTGSTPATQSPREGTAAPAAMPATRDEKTWQKSVMAVMPFVALALFFLVPIANSWLFFLLIPATAAILFGGKKGNGGC